MPDYSTNSMDLPASIRMALDGVQGPTAGVAPPSPPNMYAYQEGGMVGPGGIPMDPGGMPMPSAPASMPVATPAGLGSAPMAPAAMPMASTDDIEVSIQRLEAQAPEKLAEIRVMMQQAVQSGELTPAELNMMIQLAQVAAQDPSMYPQIRRFAIQQGLATEAELPVQYDQLLVIALLVVARSLQTGDSAAPAPVQPITMDMGGRVPASTSPDGAVPIIAHEGEFVIPKDVVSQKGTDFFNKMIGNKDTA